MLERVGKTAIPMLFFAGIPFLFAGPMIGIICWLLAAILVILLFTPMRGWLGIPASKSKSGRRIGYRGRPGSTATFRGTRFGQGLDTDIDNEGDIDVDDSDID